MLKRHVPHERNAVTEWYTSPSRSNAASFILFGQLSVGSGKGLGNNMPQLVAGFIVFSLIPMVKRCQNRNNVFILTVLTEGWDVNGTAAGYIGIEINFVVPNANPVNGQQNQPATWIIGSFGTIFTVISVSKSLQPIHQSSK